MHEMQRVCAYGYGLERFRCACCSFEIAVDPFAETGERVVKEIIASPKDGNHAVHRFSTGGRMVHIEPPVQGSPHHENDLFCPVVHFSDGDKTSFTMESVKLTWRQRPSPEEADPERQPDPYDGREPVGDPDDLLAPWVPFIR